MWLDANESPYDNGVNRYPDPRQQRLREVLAARKGIAADRIFIGSGSDEAIDLAYRIFCRPGIDNAVSIAPTYGMYRVAAAVNDVELREVPLGDDFSLPVERLLAAASVGIGAGASAPESLVRQVIGELGRLGFGRVEPVHAAEEETIFKRPAIPEER